MTAVGRARGLLDVPWVHQGRNPSVGIDCVGLLILAFEADPADHPTAYSRSPHGGVIARQLRQHFGDPVPGGPQVGDVVLMGFGVHGEARHVGVIGDYVYGGLSIIHTDSIVGRVVEHPFDAKWQRRVREVYRP